MNTIPLVDLKAQYAIIKDEIDEAISKVIDETSFIKGKYVESFEKDFEELYKVKNCISCGNGTDAIYIALRCLGIGSGDEVITTATTWISTSETISQTGAKPIFVDTEEDFFTINPDKIEEKVNEKTKAIIPVHLYGQSAEMEKIKHICEKYNLFLIEDCAQAHFAEFNGKRVGTFGDFGTFSFFPGKNLGAYGDAGAIITNDSRLAEKAKMFCNHGQSKKHDHQFEGINSRMDGIQAAVLSVKLKYIKEWTKSRIRIAKLYSDMLDNTGDLKLPSIRTSTQHVFHLYVIRTNFRNKLKRHLSDHGITTAIHYPKALPFLPAYKHLEQNLSDFNNSEKLQETVLSLPIYPELNIKQLDHIVGQIKFFFANFE